MVFYQDKNKLYVRIKNGKVIQEYRVQYHICPSPSCQCNELTLEFFPVAGSEAETHGKPARIINFDVVSRKVVRSKKKKSTRDNVRFGKKLLAQMDEDDTDFLAGLYFVYKRKVTLEARPEDIEGYFDFQEIEKGLLTAYTDVLPYAEALQVKINSETVIVLDQYCLRSGCKCHGVVLTFLGVDPDARDGMMKSLGAVRVDYEKARWENVEEEFSGFSWKTAKSAVTEQIPHFWQELRERHKFLSKIYKSNKKRHFSEQITVTGRKIGRNEPCPCGSGKKYKKCCMRSQKNK